jgi:hypothetical protein
MQFIYWIYKRILLDRLKGGLMSNIQFKLQSLWKYNNIDGFQDEFQIRVLNFMYFNNPFILGGKTGVRHYIIQVLGFELDIVVK